MSAPIDRRTVLLGLGGLAGLGGLVRGVTAAARRRGIRAWARDLAAVPPIYDLGVEYLTRHPDEREEGALSSSLQPLIDRWTVLSGTTMDRALLESWLRDDFLGDDVVRMGGWLLARTELRLCALAALEAETVAGMRGVFSPLTTPDGETIYWTAPDARVTVPAGSPDIELRVWSGAPFPQRLAIRFDGRSADERSLEPGGWMRLRYPRRDPGRPTVLELAAAPAWMPAHDFRTIGVGLDRVWAMDPQANS